jgi:hypothetical protein
MSGLLAHITGLRDEQVEALASVGIRTIGDLVCGDAEVIAGRVPSVPVAELLDAQRRLVAHCSAPHSRLDVAFADWWAKVSHIRTHTPLDRLLDGGLLTGEVCELAGGPCSGKTRLCLAASAHAALLGMSVLYVDLGHNFRASAFFDVSRRVLRAAGKAAQRQPDELSQRVHVVRAYDIDQVIEILEHAHAARVGRHEARYGQLGLVVVDNPALSLMPLLSRGSTGQLWISNLSRAVRALAQSNVAVVVTNMLVAADAPLCSGTIEDKVKPALGTSWRPLCDSRVILCPAGTPAAANVGSDAYEASQPLPVPAGVAALLDKSTRLPVGQVVILPCDAHGEGQEPEASDV